MDTSPSRPNVLLIGAPRCASTSLAYALDEHPDIRVCRPKETHFLAMNGREAGVSGIGSEAFVKAREMTHGQWADLFRGYERYLVDASVSTYSYPETSIENIRKYCDPAVRIIVALRNPVDRAYSSYMYCVSRGWPAGRFEEGLDREPDRILNGWQHLWFFKTLSQYERFLQPFLDAFGRERIHVVITEELSADPDAEMQKVFRFLDLPAAPVDMSVRFNPSGSPTSPMVARLSSFIRRQPFLLQGLKLCASKEALEQVKQRSLERCDMAEATRSRLSRELSATKLWVRDLIGREPTAWD